MEDGKISVRYARALYGFAVENHCEDEIYQSLKRFCDNVNGGIGKLCNVLSNPVLDDNNKIALIETAIGEPIHDCLKHFVRFVVSHKRENKIVFIALKYQDIYRNEKRLLKTKITTAAELPEATIEHIKSYVATTFKSDIEAEIEVDPNLIGGFMIDIENNRLDASVIGQLNQLKESLLRKS